ncbi:MAG TPA: single-stranded DNA-binding protein [Acidimicrobiia bacterium]|nr:single-stranded DNA-binding protein [Acidimicrobiia bacterium]
MDLNLVVLTGRLAAPPELRVFESGARLVRYLVTVRTEEPRHRVDVLPVTRWNPPDDALIPEPEVGQRLWVAGAVQRRFWSNPDGRRSRLEVVAEQVIVRSPVTDMVGAS